MPRIEIAELFAKMSLDRTQLRRDKADTQRDIEDLNKSFDSLSSKSAESLNRSGRAGADFGRGFLQSAAGLSLFAGGAVAAGAAVAHLSSAVASIGIGGNAQIEQYNTSFKVLLGSATAAKDRISELTTFANTTPFEMNEVVRADRVLQTFGGSLLATGRNLSLVGDIASGTNRSFEDVALWVGRTYDALQSGRPWGEAALRLQEMGALSGQARTRLEALQQSGASGNAVWSAFTKEMGTFNGMMTEQSHTASGLASTFKDELSQALRTATAPAFDAVKKALEAATSPEGQARIQSIAEDVAKISSAAGSAASAVGSLGSAISKIPVIGGLGGLVGGALGFLGTAFGAVGDTWNQIGTATAKVLGITQDGVQGVDAELDRMIAKFDQAGVAVSKTADGAAVVWIDRTAMLAQAGEQVVSSWAQGLASGLKDLKSQVDSALPDSSDSVQQLLGVADTAIERAKQRAKDLGSTSSGEVMKQSTQLKDGVQVLLQWAQGNLDACSVAAGQWGSSGPEIIANIEKVQSRLREAAAEAARIAQSGVWAVDPFDRNAAFRAEERGVDEAAKNAVIDSRRAQAQADRSPAQVAQSSIIDQIKSQQQATALDQAKAQSRDYINATVKAQQASNAARDALEKAEKAAGLIDFTTAEKDARQKQVTAVEFVQNQVTGAANTIKAGVDAFAQLSTYIRPMNLSAKLSEFARDAGQVIDGIQNIAKRYTKDQVQKLYDFANASDQGAQYFLHGVQGLDAASKAKMPSTAQIDTVLNDGDRIITRMGALAAKWSTERIVQLGIFAQSGTQGVQFAGATADVLGKLREAPKATNEAMDALEAQSEQLLNRLHTLSTKYSPEIQKEIGDFGQNMGRALEGPNKGADLLAKLPGLQDTTEYIPMYFDNLDKVITQFAARSASWKSKIDDERVKLSEDIGKEVAGISGAADLFSNINSQRTDERWQINLYFSNLDKLIADFASYSARWKSRATDAAAKLATNVGTIAETLGKGFSTLSQVGAASEVGTYEIDGAFDNFEYVLGRLEKLANNPMLQASRLAAITRASTALGAAFGGVKTAVDTTVSVGETQSKVDSGEISYGFDQIFAAATAGYAGGGTGGSGGYNNCLIINGDVVVEDDPDVATLIRKIKGHTSLVGGGVRVGAAS